MVIAGDNDVHVEQTQGINPGRTKAVVDAAAESYKARMELARTESLAQRQERGPRAIRQ